LRQIGPKGIRKFSGHGITIY
jgi:small subunit ribosomal protein S26e